MIEIFILPAILCFLRVSAFVAFLPPFGGQHIPTTVKIGLALALTAFWLPSAFVPRGNAPGPPIAETTVTETTVATTSVHQPPSSGRRWMLWTWLGAREILLGAALGWVLGLILIPLRIAGSWLAEQLGLNIASIAAGTDTGSGNVLAVTVEICGVLLLYSLRIHHDFLRIFGRFFEQFHVGHMWRFPDPRWIINLLTTLPARGLAIAAPVGVILILILIVLMFAMKQSPHFNLFTFGMPLRLAAGLIALVVMFPELLFSAARHLQRFLHTPA